MVEPNIKEGKGGLRDLNMLHWFAVYLNPGGKGQAETGLFSPGETATFNRCEAFLWTIRCYLHFLAGKPEERLSFDLQPEMARRLRYHSRLGLLGVERFMKHYFLIAKDVGDLTRTVCSCLEIRELKTVPSLSDFMGTLPWGSRARLAATTDFRVDHSRLNVKQPDAFTKDPLNLIRFFVEAERRNLLLHPEAIRLIRSSLKLIDDGFRTNPAANQLFLEAPDVTPCTGKVAPRSRRGGRARPLHPRFWPGRRDGGVQHVPLLHDRRAYDPCSGNTLANGEGRARR